MPPVRLHDLRHGTVSLSHRAGADLKDIQELLGQSSILVTADTYTSVLPPKQRRVAEATARLVLAAASRTRKTIKATARRNRPPTATPTGAPTPKRPGEYKTAGQRPAQRATAAEWADPKRVPSPPPSAQDE
jgi:hypothetical protein